MYTDFWERQTSISSNSQLAALSNKSNNPTNETNEVILNISKDYEIVGYEELTYPESVWE